MASHTPELALELHAAVRSHDTDHDRPLVRETFRAHAALSVAWAALAVIIVAYAIAKGSVGAAVLAAFVASVLRLAWAAAFKTDDDADEQRPMQFLQ